MSIFDQQRPELSGLESALKSLQPSVRPFDRDQLFFRAGQVSVRRRRWIWPCCAAMLALVSVSLGVVIAFRPAPQTVTDVVYVRVPEALPVESSKPRVVPKLEQAVAQEPEFGASWATFLRQREQLVRFGPQRLSSAMSHSSSTLLPSLERQLGLPTGSLKGPQFDSFRSSSKPGDSL